MYILKRYINRATAVNIKLLNAAVVNWVFCQVSELERFEKTGQKVDDFEDKKRLHGV